MMARALRISALVCIVSSSLVTHAIYAQQEVSFETIGTLRMRSFDLELAGDNAPQEELKDVSSALSIRMNDDEKRRLVYQLFAKEDNKRQIKDDENLKTVIENLDIFFGQGKNAKETIFNRLFEGNVETFFGEAMAAKRIAKVVVDKDQLQNYQECIKNLVDKPDLFNKLDELLKKLKNEEAHVLSFWQEQAPLSKKLINQLYFGKPLPDRFNKDVTKLEWLTRLHNCSLIFNLGGDFAMNTGMFYLSKKLFGQPVTWKDAVNDTVSFFYNPAIGIREIKVQHSPEAYQMRDAQIRQSLMQSDIILSADEIDQRNKQICRAYSILGGLKSFSSGLNLVLKVVSIKMAVSDFAQKRDTANFLQSRLIGVAQYLRILKEINQLIQVNPSLARALPVAQVYDHIFNNQSEEVRRLVELLMTETFQGKASFFSRTGRVLAAYALMDTVKDELIEALQLLGDVDACMAAAKLYKSFAYNERATYRFAEYVTQDLPHIEATDFWNPLVDPNVVVTNSMELGDPCRAHNMILTGSNKGGKSTLLKAMMLNALLAQTITMVPARRYVATPFACFATYMNVTDDTAAGLSLFQSQVTRAKKLVHTVDTLPSKSFAFIVIDEIFTGTGAQKAAKAARTIAMHLAASPSICFILATHFVDELSRLEADTHGLCKNFKVDADKDALGQIIFRHKLEEGSSTQNIANEILNDEFESIDFGVDDTLAIA